MQDKYVGDIGDYGKLILLRQIIKQTNLKLGVVWCYTEGLTEKNKDGDKRQFLRYSGKHDLRHCDVDLFDAFHAFHETGNRRVQNLHPLVQASSFFLESAVSKLRCDWLSSALRSTESDDVVFFDPDNGIAPEGTRRLSDKHIGLQELSEFWKRKQSLLIYHHLSREPGGHLEGIASTACRLARDLSGGSIERFHFRRGTSRVFFLAIHPVHAEAFSGFGSTVKPWHALIYSKAQWASRELSDLAS